MMRYAIVTGTTVVDATDNEYGAIEYAAKSNPGATYLPFATQEDVLTDPQYGIGQYIIANVRTSTLLEKSKIVNPGRLYNTEAFVVNVIDSWTIMNVSDDIQKAHGTDIRKLTPDDINKIQSMVKNVTISTPPSVVDPKAKIISTKINANDSVKAELLSASVSKVDANKPSVAVQSTMQSNAPSFIPVSTPSSSVSIKQTDIKIVNQPTVQPTPLPKAPIGPLTVSNPVNTQTLPAMIKIVSPPVNMINVNVPPKPVLQNLPLSNIAAFPLVLSIGNRSRTHRDKIEKLIYHNIAVGSLREENIVIVTNGDTKIAEAWTKDFPTCFIYDRLDTDILYHLNPESKFNKDIISKLVIFDHCLTNDFIQRKPFKTLVDNCRVNNVAMIVMTNDAGVICSSVASKLEYTLLHTFTVDWIERASVKFLSQHPAVSSQKDLESNVVACARVNNCLAFCHNTPYTLSQF